MNQVIPPARMTAQTRSGAITRDSGMPLALAAVISKSPSIRLKTYRTAMSTAIGRVCAMMKGIE